MESDLGSVPSPVTLHVQALGKSCHFPESAPPCPGVHLIRLLRQDNACPGLSPVPVTQCTLKRGAAGVEHCNAT